MPEGNPQSRTDKIVSAAQLTTGIDRMLARNSLLSSPHATSRDRNSSQGLEELYVPLPELLRTRGMRHSPSEEPATSAQQEQRVKDALNSVNEKLEDRRKKVGNMLTLLGFSSWKEDLARLQHERGLDPKTAGLALVEELIDTYREYNLDDKAELEEFREQKFGGSMSNLQRAITDYEEAGGKSWVPGVFRISWWVGHTDAAKAGMDADRENVKEMFKTIRAASKDLAKARDNLESAAKENVEREQLFTSAKQAYASGDVARAQTLASQADEVFRRMYDKMSVADELLHMQKTLQDGTVVRRYAIDYESQRKRLQEVGEKWAAVDAAYGKVLTVGDGIIRGTIMAAAVGLGMLASAATFGAATPLAAFLIGSAACFVTTTGVGFLGISAYHGSKALGTSLFSDNKSYDWSGAWKDIKNTTFETALWGIGGVAAKGVTTLAGGVRLAFGLSQAARAAQATRATVGATNVVTKGWQAIKCASGSGGLAVVTSLPSNIYHAKKDLEHQNAMLKQEILGNDTLCDFEKEYLLRAGQNPLRLATDTGVYSMDKDGKLVDAKGRVLADSDISPEDKRKLMQSGVLVDSAGRQVTMVEISEKDKQNMLTFMMGERGRAVLQCYKDDALLTFACGMGGHFAQGWRTSAMRNLAPRVPTVTNAAGATVSSPTVATSFRALASKPGSAFIQTGSHVFETVLSIHSAERSLDFRREHLGEEITDEMRARAYSMALSGQVVGNLQGDLQAKRQIQTERLQAQSGEVSTQQVRDGVKRDGVRADVDDPNIHTVIGDPPIDTKGQHFISLGHTDVDVRRATEALPLWAADIKAKIQDSSTGNGTTAYNKRIEQEIDAAIENIAANSSNPKKFFDEFGPAMRENLTRSLRREGVLKRPPRNATDSELGDYHEKLKDRADQLAAEAEYTVGRFNRGEGRDKTFFQNLMTKIGDGIRASRRAAGTLVADGFSNRKSTRNANTVFGWTVAKPLNALGKLMRGFYEYFPGAKLAYSFAKQRVFEAPIIQGIHHYIGPGAANSFLGLGGIFAWVTVGGRVMNFLGWKTSRLLGTNRARPLDASDAFASKMDIEALLRKSNELEATHPNRALDAGQKRRLQASLKRLEGMYQTSTHHSNFLRGSPLLLGTLGGLALTTGFTWPFLAYAGFTALRPRAGKGVVTTAALGTAIVAPPLLPALIGFKGLQWGVNKISGTTLGRYTVDPFFRVGSGALYNGSRFIRHDYPGGGLFRGVGRVLSGQSPWVMHIPLFGTVYNYTLGAFYRNTYQRVMQNLSRGMHRASDHLHPDVRMPNKEPGVEHRLRSDLEMVWRKGLQTHDGYDHVTLFRHLEDSMLGVLNTNNNPARNNGNYGMNRLRTEVEVLLREADPTLQGQIIDRLAARAAHFPANNPKRVYIEQLQSMNQAARSLEQQRLANTMRAANRSPGTTWGIASSHVRQRLRDNMFNRVDDVHTPVNQAEVQNWMRQYATFNDFGAMRTLIMGDAHTQGLAARARAKAADPAHAARAADLNALANTLDNYVLHREQALSIVQGPANGPVIHRSEQLARTTALENHLRRNITDPNERMEILAFVGSQLRARSDNVLSNEVFRLIDNPDVELSSNTLGWMASTERARLNAYARQARLGLRLKVDDRGNAILDANGNRQFEVDVNARTRELIDDPTLRIDGDTELAKSLFDTLWTGVPNAYRGGLRTPAVRRAARVCQELNVRSDADVDNLLAALRADPNGHLSGNAAVSWQMRKEAARMSNDLLPTQSRIIAEQNLRRMISGNLELVRGKFQSIEARANAARKQIEKILKPIYQSDDPLLRPSSDSNFDNLSHERAIVRNTRNLLAQDLSPSQRIRVSDPSTVLSAAPGVLPNFWELRPAANDYAGFGYSDRHTGSFADEFGWYGSHFRPAADETYGRGPKQRKWLGSLTGPIHRGEVSVWGASPIARWLWNRVF